MAAIDGQCAGIVVGHCRNVGQTGRADFRRRRTDTALPPARRPRLVQRRPTLPEATSPRSAAAAELQRQRTALLLALALVLVWGANFSVQKAVFASLGPGGFLFARYLIMPVCAVLLLWQRYGTRWPRLSRGEWWALVRLGIMGHLLHVGLVSYGIHWSTAFSSSLILAVGPVFTLLLLRRAGYERLTRAQVAGVAVACAGVLLFLSDKLLAASWQASSGDLVLLVAASFFSAYTVAAKPLIERHGGVTVMTYATLAGSLPVVALSLPAASCGCEFDHTRLQSPRISRSLGVPRAVFEACSATTPEDRHR
jgi:drug/metabolite transporter (DMT)-like permease